MNLGLLKILPNLQKKINNERSQSDLLFTYGFQSR